MATPTPQQVWFLNRYLDAGLPSPAPVSVRAPVTALWQDAKDTVDSRLGALSDTLRKTGIPEVIAVAGEVETLLAPLRVKLVAALREYDAKPESNSARENALKALADASNWLTSDPRLAAIDKNPWGVRVGATAMLEAALKDARRHIQAA